MTLHDTNRLDGARKLLKAGQIDAAIRECQRLLGADPSDFDANLLFGQCLLRARRTGEAAAAFRKATRLKPGERKPHESLAHLYHASGKYPEAVQHYKHALDIDPSWAKGWLDLGVACQATGDIRQAIEACRKSISIAPDSALAHNNLGSFLQQSGDLEGAASAFQRAVELDPSFADAHYNLGLLHSTQRDRDRAIACFERALELKPGHEGAIIGLAGMLERNGHIEQAYELLRPLVRNSGNNTYMLINFSQVCASLGRPDEAIAPLEARLAENGLYRREKIQLHFALGKLYDKQKSYDRAFGHYRQGNDLEPVQFNRAAYRDWVNTIIETYNSDFMRSAPRAGNSSEMPVFIIAMPRSGTTLLEQVLSSHPLVHGAGETGDIASVSAKLLPLIGNRTITEKTLDDYANRHLAHLASLAGGATRVTDKTVNSFMDLGLIQLLFPNARIIHCVRNPLDTCLSCYFSKLSDSHPYSYNLDDLAAFYLQYHRIMQHWKRVLDLEFLEVRYEDLVQDLEAGARSMIDFLGLDWDPACLEFHKAERQVTTISYDQVRRPIYTSSLNRWKHYAAHIEQLIQALEGLTDAPAA